MVYTVSSILLDSVTKSELSVFTLSVNEKEMLTDLKIKVNFKLIKGNSKLFQETKRERHYGRKLVTLEYFAWHRWVVFKHYNEEVLCLSQLQLL